MAIVPRKRARSTVYFVVTRGHWERVGSDRREAERLDARRKKEVKAGTFKPGGGTGRQTVRAYAEKWLEGRTVKAAATEAQLVRDYVLPSDFGALRMDEVKPRHIIALAEYLHRVEAVSRRMTVLAPKTVGNIIGVVRTMFRDAVIGEAISANPVVLPRGTISRKGKRRAPYELEAARAVLAGARRAEARVFAALALYTGMREGEVCGRRWGDWSASPRPLGGLTVLTQYDAAPLKTDRPRRVPVHPELDALLLWWWSEGWELVYRRKPEPEDWIVPPPRTPGRCYTKSGAYQMWRQLLRETGVQNLSLHSTRHTFLTLARRGGAREEVIERVTHNARGSMVDQYTHWDWQPLCEAVLCLPSLMTPGSSSGYPELADAPAASGRPEQRNENPQDATGNGVARGYSSGQRVNFLADPLPATPDEHPLRLQRLDSNLGEQSNQTADSSTGAAPAEQAGSADAAGKPLDGAGLAAGQDGEDEYLVSCLPRCDCCSYCQTRPCAGVTAGGFCDSLCWCSERYNDWEDDEPDNDPAPRSPAQGGSTSAPVAEPNLTPGVQSAISTAAPAAKPDIICTVEMAPPLRFDGRGDFDDEPEGATELAKVAVKPACQGCECGVPLYDGQHQEDTGIPGTVYTYPCTPGRGRRPSGDAQESADPEQPDQHRPPEPTHPPAAWALALAADRVGVLP